MAVPALCISVGRRCCSSNGTPLTIHGASCDPITATRTSTAPPELRHEGRAPQIRCTSRPYAATRRWQELAALDESNPSDRDVEAASAPEGCGEDRQHRQEPHSINRKARSSEFLRERWETFAWQPSDMPGIPEELAEHDSKRQPRAKPAGRLCGVSRAERRAMSTEVHRLTEGRLHSGDQRSHWVANPIMVPKKDIRCLAHVHRLHRPEQALPEGPLPLPRIDQIVDSTLRAAPSSRSSTHIRVTTRSS